MNESHLSEIFSPGRDEIWVEKLFDNETRPTKKMQKNDESAPGATTENIKKPMFMVGLNIISNREHHQSNMPVLSMIMLRSARL